MLHRAVLLVGVTSALKSPKNYAHEADDIKSMMEGVRFDTEGSTTTTRTPKHVSKPSERLLVEQQLLHRADNIADTMWQNDQPQQRKPEVALVVDAKDGAARFFATHGMDNMAHILGDELAGERKSKVLKEAEAQKEKMAQLSTETLVSSAKKQSTFAATTSEDNSWMDDGDDESDAYKKQWKLVDALRHSPHHV